MTDNIGRWDLSQLGGGMAAAVLALGSLVTFWFSTRKAATEPGAAASESGLTAA